MRLLELLVESQCYCMGLKYGGVEDRLGQWRKYRCSQLESFWEWGGSIHQLASLQFEMDMLPLKGEAIDFWVQVMRMDENR